MKYALTLALLFALSFGMVNQSFRALSTAGLWADDYDLLFDPARITEIQGSRLWTNLSNFMTSNEDVFDNGSVPFILLGGTTKMGSIYPALIYDRSNFKNALPTGLDDVNGDEIYGDAHVQMIDWIDVDNNGTYDRYVTADRTVSAYNYDVANDIYVAAAKVFGNKRMGLGFMHNEYKNTFTDPDNNFTYDTTDYDIVSQIYTFEAHAGFGGDSKYSGSSNKITFSAWLDKERTRFGLQADFALLKMKDYGLILGDTAVHTYPSDTTVFHTAVNVLDSTDIPQSGMDINVLLKSHHNYNENAQGRFYVGIGMNSWDYGDGALDYHRNGRLESYATFTWDTTNTWIRHSGKYGSKEISLGTRQLFTVSDRLKFGIGLFFSTGSWEDSTVALDTTLAVEVYDDNDGISIGDPQHYVETTWSSETWMTRRTGATHELSIPVGLEFTLANPVVFRLGAEHTYTIDDYTVVEQQIAYEPQRVRTVWGDGTVTETMVDPGPEYGSDATIYEKSPMTDYYYGIGWKATDNLQIDLMGFAELTDLTSWKLSATLKF